MTDPITITMPRRKLELIEKALATQVRLLSSYINRDDDLDLRIREFNYLHEDIQDTLLKD